MRSLLVIVSALAFACVAFGDDKAKAKSKATAALNLARARAEAEQKPKADTGPLTDLAKAKEAAAKDGKPLVVWVGEPAPAATVKAVDAVHCLLKAFPDAPKARAVVFRCRAGECEQKSSVESTPSPELLRTMIRDFGSRADTGPDAGDDAASFFIGTDMAEAPVEATPAPVVTRYERRTRQECYFDEYGRQRCRTVEYLVPVAEAGPAPTPPAAVSAPVDAAFVRERPVLFPRLRQFVSTVIEERPRLFDGRLVNAIACRFRR